MHSTRKTTRSLWLTKMMPCAEAPFSLSQLPGFPVVHGLVHPQFWIKIFPEIKIDVDPKSEIFKLGAEAALMFNIKRQIRNRQYCKKPSCKGCCRSPSGQWTAGRWTGAGAGGGGRGDGRLDWNFKWCWTVARRADFSHPVIIRWKQALQYRSMAVLWLIATIPLVLNVSICDNITMW